jgi:L-alanine-DL-glutamate epimerase-like enolase superfamily enzyme
MPANRRKFLQTTLKGSALALGGSSLLSACATGAAPAAGATITEPELNLGLHRQFTSPVTISAIDIVRAQGELFVRVTSADGVTGITQANQRMENLYSLLNGMIVPFFVGKDARDLELLVDEVYRVNSHYKYAGMPFWNCVGHVEIAIWDMLGKTADKPVHALLGPQVRTEIPVYLSSLTRETTPEREARELGEALARTGSKAIKIKIGGRMKNTPEDEKRTRALLPEIRKVLGNDLTIYVDSNSSYTAEEGIEIGRFLEDHNVTIFEEPCSWEDYEGNRRVTAALQKLKVAGGEQDTSAHRFQDIIQNQVYDIVQPDLYYNGGIIRTMRVSQMAAQAGRGSAPHSPKADPLEAPFLHLASVLPNLEGFQEYPARPGKFDSWYEPHILVQDGHLTVPPGPGLGISYDPALWVQAKKV